MKLRVVVIDDPAAEAAARIVAALREATSGRRASIALSGGETPWRTLARLKPADLDWTAVDVFQVDERIVPADHPHRNLRRMQEVLTLPVVIHPMPVEAADLNRSAAEYAASLPASFDIVQLGLGADGHTASLVPDDPVLHATIDVGVTGPYPTPVHPRESGDPEPRTGSLLSQGGADGSAHRRMTLTFAPINRARSILWIVTGAGKREALAALLEGKADIPANRVARDRAIVIADKAAAG